MKPFNWRKALAPLLLSVLLLVTGCGSKPPSQFADAQKESTQKGAPAAVSKDATQGSSFNKFFPKPTAGYERVFTQEKKGFSEAKLKRGGKDVAMLSISDTISLPSAAKKFESSTTKIAGFPSMDVGTMQTALLVSNRYQVKVQSRDPGFTKQDRQTWIQKFDLNGLSRLKS
ncbi:hypothetical protein K9N68_30250 [Kovacikia minuta CCNUW1]|uniref:hypothetical protein n=1 Tax=Kovacikia minuta TaxID=2931930 RepID=UPI001CCB6C4F|nr:hypothetical protein [Kovacikia minuta]UBF25783.1 hypothetical protein K9N68_30250 [Kovacikia minuta CCNUW1]